MPTKEEPEGGQADWLAKVQRASQELSEKTFEFEELAASTAAALLGGAMVGWHRSLPTALTMPAHQRAMTRARGAIGMGLKCATFTFWYCGTVVFTEGVLERRNMLGPTVGGSLAGMAFSVKRGLSFTTQGTLAGAVLGAGIGVIRNIGKGFIDDLEETMAEQEKIDPLIEGAVATRAAAEDLEFALGNWPSPPPKLFEEDKKRWRIRKSDPDVEEYTGKRRKDASREVEL